MSFDRLGLAPDLLRAVADQGYLEPTPVQSEAIPLVLARRDLLAGAQTGTGKTAAFVLPILQILGGSRPVQGAGPMAGGLDRRSPRRAPVRALVLAPTRELALQVEESVRTYGAHRPTRSTPIYGGVGFEPQARALRAGPEIVVATPGRLLDHVEQRTIDLGSVEILVLDEADRMLDMGFIRDIRRILALLPTRRQNLLFSATFSDEIRRLAEDLLDRPASVQVTPRNTTAELVRQLVHPVDRDRKRELLSHLVRSGRIDQALVFTRTKHGANRLAEQLGRDGIAAAAIHGNRSQSQRVRALADFKEGRVAILVATDIAARGIDIDALPHVVNFELPMVPSDYVHRIGRTGRAGVDGDAVSLVCIDEAKLLVEIEALLRRRIPTEVVAGFEPDRTIRPEPIRLRSAPGERPVGPPSGARSNRARPHGSGHGSRQGSRPDPTYGGHAPARRPGPGDRGRAAVHLQSGRPGPRPGPQFGPRSSPPPHERSPHGSASAHIGRAPHVSGPGTAPRVPNSSGRPPVAMPGERLARQAGLRAEDRWRG